ncbi:hypothetical protein C8R47DRAFT_1073850 [Mycena vitilis]|nr:hypothetical protein C8R47DRAFT_1073850 [Mycena vitilis]
MVQPPTATEVGEIIRSINKGGVRGLELLGLVCERPHGNGRVFKMRNADKIKAAFCRLHGSSGNELTPNAERPNSLLNIDRFLFIGEQPLEADEGGEGQGRRAQGLSPCCCGRLHQVALIAIKVSGEIGCNSGKCIAFHPGLIYLGHW